MQIYLSPTGDDSNTGLDLDHPVLTLTRAQEIIQAENPDSDVEVRIEQGTYLVPQTTWSTFITGRTISFMPIDYQLGMSLGDFAGRPVFRASGPAAWWMYAQLPSGHPGGDTGLRFYYLRVEHYQSGLMIHGRYTTNSNGVRVPATAGANGSEIRGMYFYQLGSKYNMYPGFGVAALDLVNASDTYVRANQFLYLENATPDQSHIHAVYLAHGSGDNTIVNNKLRYISGAGINIRNQSHGTEIVGNTFDHTGVHGHVSDWFCDGGCVDTSNPQECASHGTNFHDNIIGLGYNGVIIPNTVLTPPGNTYAGPAACPIFLEGERIYGNNT